VELVLPYALLGVQVGSAVTGLRFNTTIGDEVGDVVPGGWSDGGTMVPHVPHEVDELPEVAEPPVLGAYTLLGPAPLLEMTVGFPVQTAAGWQVNVTVANRLAEGHQEVVVTAGAVSAQMAVPASTASTLQLLVPLDATGLTVRAHSDAGGYDEEALFLPEVATKESPMAPVWFALLAAFSLLAVRRWR
jgi:hypothetical protein